MSVLFSRFDAINNVAEIKYIIGLDLSTVSSGIVLYDVKENNILEALVIKSEGEEKVYEQARQLTCQIEEWKSKYTIKEEKLIIAKEKQPIQYGAKTTVSTLIAIAKIHGLIENYCYQNNKILLDIAVPTIRKNVVGNYKADKEEVFNYICLQYPDLKLDKIRGGKDISDAICVALTAITALIGDYQEQVKELKKSLKEYKSDKKKQEILSHIETIKRKM